MKKTQFNEVKGYAVKELQEKVMSLKKEIADAVMDKNMNKLKDLKTISKRKKDLAQTLTVLKQKQDLGQLEAKIESKPAKEEIKKEVKTKKTVTKKKEAK